MSEIFVVCLAICTGPLCVSSLVKNLSVSDCCCSCEIIGYLVRGGTSRTGALRCLSRAHLATSPSSRAAAWRRPTMARVSTVGMNKNNVVLPEFLRAVDVTTVMTTLLLLYYLSAPADRSAWLHVSLFQVPSVFRTSKHHLLFCDRTACSTWESRKRSSPVLSLHTAECNCSLLYREARRVSYKITVVKDQSADGG